MINPDQLDIVRQLQHHDRRAAAAAYQMERECAHARVAAQRSDWSSSISIVPY